LEHTLSPHASAASLKEDGDDLATGAGWAKLIAQVCLLAPALLSLVGAGKLIALDEMERRGY